MCGIVAIADSENIDIGRYCTESMIQELRFRGPDGSGKQWFSRCWLGHRRLAVLDIENGNQPMMIDDLCIVFNGEIYNYSELRVYLEKQGYRFHTRSDTEVILHAYREWGDRCPEHLDGMFSFVIWNEKRGELFFARDRLGKKPLYYCFDNNTILIASEIKALVASGAIVPQIDFGALDNYLRLMYVPPWKSIFKNIHLMPPAHCGTFKEGKLLVERYWKLVYDPAKISYEESKSEVNRLLRKAVTKRLNTSDVEVGTFLSGGIDSTLVAFIAAECLRTPLKTFSVGYVNANNEIPFVQQVCERLSTENYEVQIENSLIYELDKVIKYFDEPHADTSDFPQHLVSQLAAKQVKVVLSGDGGDELFWGYKWHLQGDTNPFERRCNSICAFSADERHLLWKSPDAINDDILAPNIYDESLDPMQNVAMFDLTSHLPGQILSKVDRAGMMHGLEVRSPFLDTALIEFVFNLPVGCKIQNGEQKYILKDILGQYMPHDFIYRRKQGFGAPIDKWLRDDVTKAFVRTQLGANARIRSLFSGARIDKYLEDFYARDWPHNRAAQRIWVLICLERWLLLSGVSL